MKACEANLFDDFIIARSSLQEFSLQCTFYCLVHVVDGHCFEPLTQNSQLYNQLTSSQLPEEVGHVHIYKYVNRLLNVISSGKILLVTTTLLKQEGLPRVTHFKLLYTDIVSLDVYIPIHNMDLSATVLAENNRITLSKESTTKTLSNLEDAYLFYL